MRQIRSVLGPPVHVAFLAHHLYVFGYAHQMHAVLGRAEHADVDQRISDIKTFSAVFFTNWNITIQTIYFALAVLHDVLNICSLMPDFKDKIDQWKGFLFTSFVFPFSIFVSAMFWSVYSINREWVLPEVCDKYVPAWLNHSLHTNILVFLVVEVLIANQLLPTFKTAFIALTAMTIIYDIAFFIAYFIYGRFIYGLFHVFNWPERILFILFNYFATILTMKLGIIIENFKYSLSRTRAKPLKN